MTLEEHVLKGEDDFQIRFVEKVTVSFEVLYMNMCLEFWNLCLFDDLL